VIVEPHQTADAPTSRPNTRWALLTNHGAVRLFVARNPNSTERQVGDGGGITERAAARILRDAGYLRTTRIGRRNSDEVDQSQPLRHRATRDGHVEDLMHGLLGAPVSAASPGPAPSAPPGAPAAPTLGPR